PPAFVLSQDQTLRRKFVTQFVADFKNLKRLVRFWFCLVFKDHFAITGDGLYNLTWSLSLCQQPFELFFHFFQSRFVS
ncbi:hypothetical protein, partial [Metabacillus idriensis]|uniref:hypothetical protein n=1 Tax=Metabacillus idriensis TaxID=324768 RepID=UPI001CD65754